MRICAVDPGIGGAIAIIKDQKPQMFYDMPIQKVKSKTLICPDKLAEILQLERSDVVVCEQVGASPNMGTSGAFNFGLGFGMIQGVCAGLMIPCYTVTPQRWKTYHGLQGKPKDAARLKLQLMFPQFRDELKLKKHVDRADACLMGLAWAALHMQDKMERK